MPRFGDIFFFKIWICQCVDRSTYIKRMLNVVLGSLVGMSVDQIRVIRCIRQLRKILNKEGNLCWQKYYFQCLTSCFKGDVHKRCRVTTFSVFLQTLFVRFYRPHPLPQNLEEFLRTALRRSRVLPHCFEGSIRKLYQYFWSSSQPF